MSISGSATAEGKGSWSKQHNKLVYGIRNTTQRYNINRESACSISLSKVHPPVVVLLMYSPRRLGIVGLDPSLTPIMACGFLAFVKSLLLLLSPA